MLSFTKKKIELEASQFFLSPEFHLLLNSLLSPCTDLTRKKERKKKFRLSDKIFLTLMKQDLMRLIFQYVVNRLIPGQIRFFQSWNSIRTDHKRALNSFSLLKRGHLPAMFQTHLDLLSRNQKRKFESRAHAQDFTPRVF